MSEGTRTELAVADRDEAPGFGPPSDASARQLDVKTTRLEQALDWAAGLAPSPMRIATSCCGMSLIQGGDPFEVLGMGPPAVSSRSADLLLVAGSVTRRQVPMLLDIYERMLEPRWVIAWGACAISGGAYDNYATISGLGRILPVDLVVPGCPPAPVALREALELLRSGATRHPSRRSLTSRQSEEWPILRTERPLNPTASDAAGHAVNEPKTELSPEMGEAMNEEGNENVDRG